MGSIVYRTREALNRNKTFLTGLNGYRYADSCFLGDRFQLWHYPGTHSEISAVLRTLGTDTILSSQKFPGLLTYQNIRQDRSGLSVTIHYNLALVAPVLKDWSTETREVQAFDMVLRPMYREFLNQIILSGYFDMGYGTPQHAYYEVFTTGESGEKVMDQYGDYLDAVELHGLRLTLKDTLCKRHYLIIEDENKKVTENINTLKH